MNYLIDYKLFENFEDYIFKTTQEDEYITITAYFGKEKAGTISYHMETCEEEDWYFSGDFIIMITDVSVDEYFQKIGLGSELMKRCLISIKKQYPFIKLAVLNASPTGFRNRIPLTKLVEFYKKFGFTEYKPEGGNVIMLKRLKK